MRNVVMGFVLYMVYTGESILLDKMAAILADDIAKCIFLNFDSNFTKKNSQESNWQ